MVSPKRPLPPAALACGALLALAAAALPAASPLELTGMCDGSAAAPLDANHFAAADDERNLIAVYRRDRPGPPVFVKDMTDDLSIDPKNPEADVEGAARVGDTIYWIASHGTNEKGKARPNRRRLFATRIAPGKGGWSISLRGTAYRRLVEDLTADDRLDRFDLARAAERPAKDPLALNIEGLAATPDGHLLIGFRCPIIGGKALLVPLENPAALVDSGGPVRFGAPIELDLGGLGIRDIVLSESSGGYVIVAGPAGPEPGFSLFRWSGRPADKPAPIPGANLGDLRPEAVTVFPGTPGLLLLSDDGTRTASGVECKDVEATAERSFRMLWMER